MSIRLIGHALAHFLYVRWDVSQVSDAVEVLCGRITDVVRHHVVLTVEREARFSGVDGLTRLAIYGFFWVSAFTPVLNYRTPGRRRQGWDAGAWSFRM